MTTGIESSGAQQHHNWLQFNSSGCDKGPSQYGIKMDNGSRHSTISGNLHRAGRDGMYISGDAHDTLFQAIIRKNWLPLAHR